MTSTERPTARTATTSTHGALTEQMDYARALAQSDMLPPRFQGRPANVLWAAGYAEMLGLHTLAVINGMHDMKGQPTAKASFISMLVRRAGHRLDVYTRGDTTNLTAVAELTRADAPGRTFTVEWTWERAQKADLTRKDTWKQYPDAMLKARAATEVARDVASDATFGILYTPEELGADNTDDDGMITGASSPATPAPEPEQREPAPMSEGEETARAAREALERDSPPEKIDTAPAFEESPERVAFVEKMRQKLEEAGNNLKMLNQLREFVADSARLSAQHRFVTSELDPAIAEAESEQHRFVTNEPASSDSAEEFDWEAAIEDSEQEGDTESLQIYVDTLENKRGGSDRTTKIAKASLKRALDQQPSEA